MGPFLLLDSSPYILYNFFSKVIAGRGIDEA